MSELDLDDTFNAAAPPKMGKPTRDDILGALRFGPTREVNTSKGPRLVRNAPLTPLFDALYNDPAERDSVRSLGYTKSEFPRGTWQIAHWSLPAAEIIVKREESKKLSRATDADINAPVPEGLAYLGYQRAGIAFGYDRPATLIGDEMGLGKTIQAIGILNCLLAKRTDLPRVLVICPASLKLNWRKELLKWLIKKMPIFIADSSMLPDLLGVVVVNYDVLHRHTEIIHRIEYDLLIVDEAHYLKSGKKARRARMVLGAKATKKDKAAGMVDAPGIRAKKRLFLTGTPIANKPAELFPLINYLDPGQFPSFWSFAKRYCGGGNGFAGSLQTDGASHLDELQDRLRSSIMVRRLKKDVLKDLPPKRRQVLEIPADKSLTDKLRQERETFEANESGLEEAQAAVELAKASDDPAVYKAAVENLKGRIGAAFGMISVIRRETAEAKIPFDIEHLTACLESSGKVIAFAHHKSVVAAVAKEFGDAAVSLVGDTPMEARQAAVDRFQTDPSCKLFIGSIMAAGVGITLTAASHVVFLELDWVPGNVTQAEDRAHRIGQTESVLIQHLVLEDSLDAVIAKRIVAKQEIIEKALDTEKTAIVEEAPTKGAAASSGVTPDKLASLALGMTPLQRVAAHEAVRHLSAVCNGARDWDGLGFSKIDTSIGKSLAAQKFLSPKQAALAMKIALKYRGQLGEKITAALEGKST